MYAIQLNRKGALALDANGAPMLFSSKAEAQIRGRWLKGTPVPVSLTKRKIEDSRRVWVVVVEPMTALEHVLPDPMRWTPWILRSGVRLNVCIFGKTASWNRDI
jgi:hypothetical protein